MLLGAVSAADDSVSIKEDSNLDDNVDTLSFEYKLGISNEDSISVTNIVNSQNDDFGNSSNAILLGSDLEGSGDLKTFNYEMNNCSSSSDNSIVGTKASNKVPVNLKVTSAIADTAKTVFKVSVTDSENGKAVTGNKVALTVDGSKYIGTTDSNGIAEITAKSLNNRTYAVKLRFAGTLSRYEETEVTQKVNVIFNKGTVTWGIESAVADTAKTVFKVSLKDSLTGNPIRNVKVSLTVDGGRYIGTTDDNGIAEITAKSLNGRTYAVTLYFAGTSRYEASEVTKKASVIFNKGTVTWTIKSAVADTAKTVFKVSLKDKLTGNPIHDVKVSLTVDGSRYIGTTDSDGIAEITAKSLSGGTHTVALYFAGTSRYGASDVTKDVDVFRKVLVDMEVTNAVANSTGTIFRVSVTDSETGKALAYYKIELTVDGSRYVGTTNGNGLAKIATKSLVAGNYAVTLYFAGTASRYDVTEVTQDVKVFRKVLVSMSAADAKYTDSKTSFSVSAINSATKKPVNNVKIFFILDGVTYQGVTGSDGVAVITTKHLNEGTYTVTMKVEGTSTYEATSVTQKVKVSKEPDSIALKDLITASKNVKQFIENNEELPDTVTIAGRTYSAAQFLYFASEAIHKLESKDTSAVAIKAMKTPDSYTPATNLGNLYTYYSVAKRIMEFGDKNALMPTYATSDVGNIGYDGLIYAFARIIAFYGDNSVMPSYVAIKAVSHGIVPDDVNTKNTIKDLTPYLNPSKNCQSDDPEIVALANKLTQGLTSTFAKAEAIYNYVRDYVSYSYYYDTKYGAVGTLHSKTGNCVDQAHLVVALSRAANLPARYVHGTCTFSDGTFGHVWAQILVGDIWTVADPVSTRNSLGHIANWNTKTYTLHGYYSSLPF